MEYKSVVEIDEMIEEICGAFPPEESKGLLKIYILELQAEHITLESKIRTLEKENEKLEIELQKEKQVTRIMA